MEIPKKHYIIYKITNLINGKIYIGQHQTFNLDDGYMGSSAILNSAIKKYGIENFKKEILKECNTFDEMNRTEAEIVDKDFIARSDTYNVSVGGTFGWENCNKALRNNEEKEVLRKKHAAEGVRRWAANLSEEDHLAKSEYWINYYRTHKNPFSGKTHSEDTRKKISASMKIISKTNANPTKGKHWYKNPNDKTQSKPFKSGEEPSGWVRGKWPTEKEIESSKNPLNKGHKAITNGISTKYIEYSDSFIMPIGWRFGTSSKGSLNKIWITNGKERKLVDKTLEIPDGWYKGMK